MAKTVVYDKAKFHYEGNYPEGLPRKQAFVHTGMFLGWIIERGLYSREFAELEELISSFATREVTGPKVYEECDGVLVDNMLNDEGNAFAQYYFDFDKGRYLSDYEKLLARNLPTLYHVEDTWENYDKIRARIDQRYQEWKSGGPRKWWRFGR